MLKVGVKSRRRHHARLRGARAFTLLEVILALVILGAAMAIFGEVMQLANRAAVDSRAETQGQLLAASVMDEILAGVRPQQNASRQPLDVQDTTGWLFTVNIGTSDVQGVLPLEVVVEQDLEQRYNPVKVRLVRWIPSVAETDENAEQAAQGQQGGQQGGANGGTTGGGTPGGAGSAGGGVF
jgi:prepilin-type N-terminal cleavage/methylation domain-containing protein